MREGDDKKTTENDIRAYNPKTHELVSYIDTLKADLKWRNAWIYKGEWAKIEELLPNITEEKAKEQCFIIHNKIRARVDYDRHQYG